MKNIFLVFVMLNLLTATVHASAHRGFEKALEHLSRGVMWEIASGPEQRMIICERRSREANTVLLKMFSSSEILQNCGSNAEKNQEQRANDVKLNNEYDCVGYRSGGYAVSAEHRKICNETDYAQWSTFDKFDVEFLNCIQPVLGINQYPYFNSRKSCQIPENWKF